MSKRSAPTSPRSLFLLSLASYSTGGLAGTFPALLGRPSFLSAFQPLQPCPSSSPLRLIIPISSPRLSPSMKALQSWEESATTPTTSRTSSRAFPVLPLHVSSLLCSTKRTWLTSPLSQNVRSTATPFAQVPLDHADLPSFLSSNNIPTSRSRRSIQRFSFTLSLRRRRVRRLVLPPHERRRQRCVECWQERETETFSHSEARRKWGEKSTIQPRRTAKRVAGTSVGQ